MSAASNPTASDKEELKTIIANELGVAALYLKDFRIDSVSAARRLIRRRLLASYIWNVDFTLRIPISVSGLDSTSSLSTEIASALTSDAFLSIVASQIGATVDITSIVTEVTSTRKTSQPTLSTTVDINTNNNITSSKSDVVLLFILIGLPVIGIMLTIFYCRQSHIMKNISAIIGKYISKEQTVQMETNVAADTASTAKVPPKVISVLDFLQDDVKLQTPRVLYITKQFADQGYERANDLIWVTNREFSDHYLQDVIDLKQLEIRKLRAAIIRTFKTKVVQASELQESTSEARDTGSMTGKRKTDLRAGACEMATADKMTGNEETIDITSLLDYETLKAQLQQSWPFGTTTFSSERASEAKDTGDSIGKENHVLLAGAGEMATADKMTGNEEPIDITSLLDYETLKAQLQQSWPFGTTTFSSESELDLTSEANSIVGEDVPSGRCDDAVVVATADMATVVPANEEPTSFSLNYENLKSHLQQSWHFGSI